MEARLVAEAALVAATISAIVMISTKAGVVAKVAEFVLAALLRLSIGDSVAATETSKVRVQPISLEATQVKTGVRIVIVRGEAGEMVVFTEAAKAAMVIAEADAKSAIVFTQAEAKPTVVISEADVQSMVVPEAKAEAEPSVVFAEADAVVISEAEAEPTVVFAKADT